MMKTVRFVFFVGYFTFSYIAVNVGAAAETFILQKTTVKYKITKGQIIYFTYE